MKSHNLTCHGASLKDGQEQESKIYTVAEPSSQNTNKFPAAALGTPQSSPYSSKQSLLVVEAVSVVEVALMVEAALVVEAV